MLCEGRPPVDAQSATVEDLEEEANWIQDNLHAVPDRHEPGKAPGARSERLWKADIKQMRRSCAGARRAYKGGRTSFDEYLEWGTTTTVTSGRLSD
jgi:hypothetical protein